MTSFSTLNGWVSTVGSQSTHYYSKQKTGAGKSEASRCEGPWLEGRLYAPKDTRQRRHCALLTVKQECLEIFLWAELEGKTRMNHKAVFIHEYMCVYGWLN